MIILCNIMQPSTYQYVLLEGAAADEGYQRVSEIKCSIQTSCSHIFPLQCTAHNPNKHISSMIFPSWSKLRFSTTTTFRHFLVPSIFPSLFSSPAPCKKLRSFEELPLRSAALLQDGVHQGLRQDAKILGDLAPTLRILPVKWPNEHESFLMDLFNVFFFSDPV